MDYDAIAKTKTDAGLRAVASWTTTCMVKVLRRIARFYCAESCGRCTPCREGTGWLYRMLTRIIEGKGQVEDLARLDDVAKKIEGRTICALGDASPRCRCEVSSNISSMSSYYVEHGSSMAESLPGKAA